MDKQERIQLVRDIKAIINNELDLKKDSTDEEIEELIARAVFQKSRELYLSSCLLYTSRCV